MLEPGDEVAPGLAVVEDLGGGKRFQVYLATDDRRLTTVIVKVLRPERVTNPRSVASLRHEASILRALAHPAIVRLLDAVEDGDRPRLVLEHIDGPTLRQLVARAGPVQAEELASVAVGLCGALHYLHGEGLVHLDVKPSNVIVGVRPVLVDFSVARAATEAAGLSRAIGTRAYMAPEVRAAGEGSPIGPPADVWSLGATLLEVASGSRPKEDPIREATSLPTRVPPELREVIAAALAPDPGARPAPAEIVERLEALVAGFPAVPKLRRGRPRLH